MSGGPDPPGGGRAWGFGEMRVGLAIGITAACVVLPSVAGQRIHAAVDGDSVFSTAPSVTRHVSVRHPVATGETFAGILASYGVAPGEVAAWVQAGRKSKVDLARLSPGRWLRLEFTDGRLAELEYPVDDERRLYVSCAPGEPACRGQVKEVEIQVRLAGASGEIQTSFYEAARESNLDDSVISAFVDLMAWQVDFTRDVRRGDRFRVVYERRFSPEGRELTPGRIVAADYTGRVRSASAFLFVGKDGKTGYLDGEGRPLEQAFLRYPVEFTRISSTFSRARFHPILKRTRPHRGVDFAAPSGTPVRAIGDGVVRFAGRKGALGRHVEIDHNGRLVSAYSHLRAIAREVRRGTRVRRGQVIGWVGMTGLATGPHLHFAIFQDGRCVNPLKIKRPPAAPPVDEAAFAAVRLRRLRQLQRLAGGTYPMPGTPVVTWSPLAQARSFGPLSLTL